MAKYITNCTVDLEPGKEPVAPEIEIDLDPKEHDIERLLRFSAIRKAGTPGKKKAKPSVTKTPKDAKA